MGKTYRNFKGETYTPSTHDQKKKQAKTKFFGFTSGNHTQEHDILSVEDRKLVRTHETRPPVKGKDFIKYGYPHPFYPKDIYQRKKRGEDIW